MTITTIQNETIRIDGAPALDPITVVFRDAEPGRGGIIVDCYGKAWSAFWGGMGNQTVKQFVASTGPDYLMNRLWRDGEKRTKREEEYLMRITTAIITALNLPSAPAPFFR